MPNDVLDSDRQKKKEKGIKGTGAPLSSLLF